MTTTDLSINALVVTEKIGDHQMIDLSLEVHDPNTRTQQKQVLDYKRANFELMKEELGSINYEGSKQTPNNNHPISLTSVIRKTIERLFKIRITKPLEDQNLIIDTQDGFREKRSCLTNLLDFFGEDNRVYDRTNAVDLLCLDFQKTSDKVSHERLMAKVEAHGIQGNYSPWIQNWLASHTQQVMIHDQASGSKLVTSGVPQGSVLGPLLFIIYINDLDGGIISNINKFADDTELSHKAFTERDRETIQSDLNRLLQWTGTWQMSVSIDKCSVMRVGTNNWHFLHTINDIPTEAVQQQRDLCVIANENLKHDKHVEKALKMRIGFLVSFHEILNTSQRT
ncbi:Reverse transcriptase domain [Trinorchestia longiramus]|nr:Reverse transcriptase domain [Trinorchestia longiramus]